MRGVAGFLIAAGLALGSGCARSDWIERTLVTVDVTGVWSGQASGAGSQPSFLGFDLTVDLEQQGPKVKGTLRPSGFTTWLRLSPIEGTVTGDMFEFAQTNATIKGVLTVSGDEMAGEMTAGRTRYQVILRRVDASPRAVSPPR